MAATRNALPRSIGHSEKRTAGKTAAARTPLNLRGDGIRVDERLEAHIRDSAGRKLGKFAQQCERVTVRLKDVNGPKGGVDCNCTIKVVVSGLPSVVVTEPGAQPREAFDLAIRATERTLRRTIQAHRPARGGGSAAANVPRAARRGRTATSQAARRGA